MENEAKYYCYINHFVAVICSDLQYYTACMRTRSLLLSNSQPTRFNFNKNVFDDQFFFFSDKYENLINRELSTDGQCSFFSSFGE